METRSKLPHLIPSVAAMATLAAAVLLFHGSALSGYWRFDDPGILDFSLNQSLIEALYRPEVWQKLGAPFFTPLLTLSYGIDIRLFGLVPYGFYLHQLAVLFLAAWMTYCLLLRWVSPFWAWLGGILFLSGFPVAVIAQQVMTRHYVEGLIFSIAALLCFFKSIRYRWLVWLGALCYLLAMLAKEVYAPLVFFLLAVETFGSTSKKVFLGRIAPYVLVVVIYAPWRLYMLGGMGGYAPQLVPSLEEAGRFFSSVPDWLFADGAAGTAVALLVAGLLAAGLKNGTIRPLPTLVSVGLLVGPLLPVMASFTFPLGTDYFIGHRYLFLPWWALSCALVLVLARTEKQWLCSGNGQRKWTRILPLLCCFALGGATVQRQSAACLDILIAENERVYKMAWGSGTMRSVAVPQELAPYTRLMFDHIAAIRKISVAELPPILGKGESHGRGAAIADWGYDPYACGSDATLQIAR